MLYVMAGSGLDSGQSKQRFRHIVRLVCRMLVSTGPRSKQSMNGAVLFELIQAKTRRYRSKTLACGPLSMLL